MEKVFKGGMFKIILIVHNIIEVLNFGIGCLEAIQTEYPLQKYTSFTSVNVQ